MILMVVDSKIAQSLISLKMATACSAVAKALKSRTLLLEKPQFPTWKLLDVAWILTQLMAIYNIWQSWWKWWSNMNFGWFWGYLLKSSARLLELLQLHLDLPWWEGTPCEFVPETSGNRLGYDGYFVCRCLPYLPLWSILWEPPQMHFVKILKFPECPCPNMSKLPPVTASLILAGCTPKGANRLKTSED